MLKIAINRPVTILMTFLGLLIFGVISIFTMPINLYPNVDIPLVKITTFANADLSYVESQITKKLENQISGVSQIKRITSKSFNNLSVIAVEFELGRDLEIAVNDIREKISKIKLEYPPSVEKVSSDAGAVMSIFISSKQLDDKALMQIIEDDIEGDFQRIKGVGEVKMVGYLKNNIKIDLNLDELNKYHINSLDVAKLIKMQNFKTFLGSIENEAKNITIKGYFDSNSIEELEQLRIAPGVFLKDVADISIGYTLKDSYAHFNGDNGVLVELKKITGQNSLEVAKNIKQALIGIQDYHKNIEFEVVYDKSENITKHINQVVFDMCLGVILTILIVFLFLRNISATIIASIAIPTSIISSFFLIDLFGYDLNRLTLIALTLSIGIFVDDAIVVIENISKKIKAEKNALYASYEGIKDIAFSVFSISIVLLCVFIPISFMNSISGLFFNTLGMSVAFGVIISFLVCVFLVPTISARFLNTNESKFHDRTEKYFIKLESWYENTLDTILEYKKIFIGIILILCALSFSLAPKIGLDFLPMEDDSELQVQIESKKDLSIEVMEAKSLEVLKQIKENKNVDYAYLLVGYDDAKDRKKSKIYVKLKPLNERTERQKEVVSNLRDSLSLKEFKIKVLEIPKFEGAGIDEPVQFVLLGDDFSSLVSASRRAKNILSELKGVVDISDDIDAYADVLAIYIDKEKARKLNVNTQELAGIIQTSFAHANVGVLDGLKDSKDIFIQLEKVSKEDMKSLEKIQIRTMDNNLISLLNVVNIRLIKDSSSINRLNKTRSVKITAGVDRVSLDEVKAKLETNMSKIMQNTGLRYTFTGFIDLLEETMIGFAMVMLLSFLLIYLVLAALYESFIVPFVIMITMPLAFAGACIGLYLTGNTFSLFVLVALILLFGMVGKNAILLIDVANKLCDSGVGVKEALKIAGKSRIRAILMTTIAMIFAMLPLAISHGAGYESNSPMAVAVISGLISSTILTLFAIPAIYEVCYKLDRKLKRIYKRDLI
ncbi:MULTISPECIES: efflux RND transporter permease subunit [unclassified Campylobacter]|uniref:efflux RND transporter permease subunit n=1 Tax=unclassified Campylobacter TaxID=2593542 RepID=UPI001BDACFD3|nr:MULTISPECIES: efflux RND transporter permease subunit [unclassified Campylobacter]MBT0881302.1 efflux RND transporter permease subunit [Campylobacter sp. 2018MI27]MBT0884504.1 efflux RND transporter permease subunit [Campylobacter sp. 2018MI10]